MISAREALKRLREGNRRFASGVQSGAPWTDQTRRMELVEGQEPFAIILGCSDSRVPAEIIFHHGLGALFVIRVAGNLETAHRQLISVERLRVASELSRGMCHNLNNILTWSPLCER